MSLARSILGFGGSGFRKFSTLRSIHFVEVKHEFHDIVKWNEPNKLSIWDPQRSCDLRSLPKVDSNTLRLEYKPFAGVIEKLPKDDQKLFTLALGRRKDNSNIIMEEITSLTKRHKYDRDSTEFKVAKLTFQIRNYQDIFRANSKKCKGQMKSTCKEAIEKRHKFLTRLKNEDVKKFEWVLQLLGIIYKPLPEVYERLHRISSLKKLTHIYCNAICSKRLFDYKLELEGQKLPFLEEKLFTLQQIKADEDSMRLSSSVDEDIKETMKRIDTLKNNPVEIKPVEQLELVPSYQVPDTLFVIGSTKNSVRY